MLVSVFGALALSCVFACCREPRCMAGKKPQRLAASQLHSFDENRGPGVMRQSPTNYMLLILYTLAVTTLEINCILMCFDVFCKETIRYNSYLLCMFAFGVQYMLRSFGCPDCPSTPKILRQCCSNGFTRHRIVREGQKSSILKLQCFPSFQCTLDTSWYFSCFLRGSMLGRFLCVAVHC